VLKHETEHHRKRKSVQQSLDEEIGNKKIIYHAHIRQEML